MLSNVINGRRIQYAVFSTIAIVSLLLVGQISPSMAQATRTDDLFTTLYDDVSPSVVSISVVSNQTDAMGQQRPAASGGTGFVLDTEGHIMTNNHVVEGATEIEVSFVDGTRARATVVGLDPDSDLAVLQVELPAEDLATLQPAVFGDSEALRIGETVLAIGSPFGQRWTLTSGIVSALDRSIQGLTNFSIGGVIQTDAAINPGNSGGPLLNLDGEVIGVNSQIISGSRSSAGIGFAVPGNLARRVGDALIEQGYIEYSYIGLAGGDISLDLIEAFDLPNDMQGVVVSEVTAGGPAMRAGVQSAVVSQMVSENTASQIQSVDIITAIDGYTLTGMNGLVGYLAAETQPGDTVQLSVLRLFDGGQTELTVDVTLMPRP